MINPKYTYVGFGGFYSEAAPYPATMAGEFSGIWEAKNFAAESGMSGIFSLGVFKGYFPLPPLLESQKQRLFYAI